MKKYILSLAGALAISTATSSASLLLTFTEDGADVVMQVSGSVDVSRASFVQDDEYLAPLPRVAVVYSGEVHAYGDDVTSSYGEISQGVDLLIVDLISSWSIVADSSSTGTGWFLWSNDYFYSFSVGDAGVLDNDTKTASVTTSNIEMTFLNQSFNTMGLDAHAADTVIDLWGAAADATDSEKVQFIVSTAAVPEPSSTALLGLGTLGVLLRRRR